MKLLIPDNETVKLFDTYTKIRETIVRRLQEFKKLGDKNDDRIFEELVFCLLTPQSKARICWNAVLNLRKKGLIKDGQEEEILNELTGVRFKYNKARYIVEARKKFTRNGRIEIKATLQQYKDPIEVREWLVRNIKGLGYKEASHFLRNIGHGKTLAILDRHILKNLKYYRVISDIPGSLTRKRYLEIEKKMQDFSRKIGIPMDHLDLLLWFNETGEVFK